MMMTLETAAKALNARFTAPAAFSHVDSDTRKLSAGALFVALRGERFDGHEFISQAQAAGAAAALVDERGAGKLPAGTLPLLVVEDTRAALGALAAFWRLRFDIPIIGITGSNGKTTVKDMCASIMRVHCRSSGNGDDAVLATQGNLNNDIGVPLTLLSLRETHRAAVIEMGMNHPGELAYLTGLVQPSAAVVTNAQRAHLLGLKSVSEIAREKGRIYDGLPADGVAVVNADDAYADYWLEINHARQRTVMTFGFDRSVDVSGQYNMHGFSLVLRLRTPQGEETVNMQVAGEHNARNALAAAAVCLAVGATLASIVSGLAGYAGTRGRLTLCRGVAGAAVLDDSYNANPDSVRAGIDVLAAMSGKKVFVFGDMGEIGMSSAQAHDEIGGYAKSKGVDVLLALGDMSAVAVHNFGEGAQHFRTLDALMKALMPQIDADTVVLVKGSRFMHMERVVDSLLDGEARGNNERRAAGRKG